MVAREVKQGGTRAGPFFLGRNTMKWFFSKGFKGMKKKNSMSDVPTDFREAASAFKTDIGSKHWAKMVKVLSILMQQEARGLRMDTFLNDSTQCSPGQARQLAMLKLVPAPFVDRPLSEAYFRERMVRTGRVSRTKSIFWLCDLYRGKESDLTRLTVVMFKAHDQEGRRVYGLFHDRKGDDYSSYCDGAEVIFTYCYSLPHLVEHVLSTRDLDAILLLEKDDFDPPR